MWLISYADVLRQAIPMSWNTTLSPLLCDVARHRNRSELTTGSDLFPCWAFGCSGGWVVPGGVKGEVAQYFSGGDVDDFDVVFLGEDQDAGSVVDATDAALHHHRRCDRRDILGSSVFGTSRYTAVRGDSLIAFVAIGASLTAAKRETALGSVFH